MPYEVEKSVESTLPEPQTVELHYNDMVDILTGGKLVVQVYDTENGDLLSNVRLVMENPVPGDWDEEKTKIFDKLFETA